MSCNMFKHVHAAWACSMDMQHSMNMLNGEMYTKHGHAA